MRRHMCNFQKLLLVFCLVLGCSCLFGQTKPNVIIILADDLGYGDLGVLGSKDIRTPNIDCIAKNGMQFKRFYANSTVCSPTRASLLSGKYPDKVGVPGVIRQDPKDNWGQLNAGVELLPNVLKKNGYHTAMIGKWHLGYSNPNLPNAKGFEHFKGFLGDMMDDYYLHRRGGVNWMRFNELEIDPLGHATDLFTQWSLEYLQEQKNSKQPFFLFLSYNAPHFPSQPPQDVLEDVVKRLPSIDEKRQKNIALVEHLDASVGKVLEALKKNNQLDNTVVFFTSDNGGSLPHAQSNGALNGGKQDMLEGGIKVPLFVLWNDVIPKGSLSNQIAMTMDVFPTICELAGVQQTSDTDGQSFLTAMKGIDDQKERTLFWVRKEGGNYRGQHYYAARKGAYKILQNHPDEQFKLYNIDADPFERNQLDSSLPVFQKLSQALRNHIDQANKTQLYKWDQGAIVQGNSTKKRIAFVLTGDEFYEGLNTISNMFDEAKIKGSFFFTGRLYRNTKARKSIVQLSNAGHYMGPHSDMHLLYNDWIKRDSLLVSKDSLVNDLKANYQSMHALGIQEEQLYFIPPYEWWNNQVASWCKEMNVQLINFSPGTGTNADYTYPEMGSSYRSSEKLLERLYAFEKQHTLNGAMVLVHIGTDPRRKDKLYHLLPNMIQYFRSKGYEFVKVDELLSQ
ncbi:MAG: sulfatase-like hydrolase/transferase [Bacteroidota bacterium]|jgi:arylsulfatase A-like enzyme